MHALSSTLREDDVGGRRIYGAFDSTARPRGRGCRGLAEGQPRSLRAGKIIVGVAATVGCSDGYVVASLRFASHGTGAFEPPRAAALDCGMVRNASRTRTELLGCGCGALGGLKPRSWHRDARPSPNGSGQPAESDAIRLDNATGLPRGVQRLRPRPGLLRAPGAAAGRQPTVLTMKSRTASLSLGRISHRVGKSMSSSILG